MTTPSTPLPTAAEIAESQRICEAADTAGDMNDGEMSLEDWDLWDHAVIELPLRNAQVLILLRKCELQERLIAALDAARQPFDGRNEEQVLNAAFLSRDIRRELAALESGVTDA